MKRRSMALWLAALLLVLGLAAGAVAQEQLLTVTGFGTYVTEDGNEVLTIEATTESGEAVAFIGDKPNDWVTGAEMQNVSVHRERDPNVQKEYYTMEDLILARVECVVLPEGLDQEYVAVLAPDAQFAYVMEDGRPVLVFSETYFAPYVPEEEEAPAE